MQTKLSRPLEKIGGIFQESTFDVSVAWAKHFRFVGRDSLLTSDETEGYLETLLDLKRAVRRAAQPPGYFLLDGYLVGYGGPDYDPRWLIYPDHFPLDAGDGSHR